jgi:hypothetical protein
MKAISELPKRGAPISTAVGHPGIPGEGPLLEMPSAGCKLGLGSQSSGGCRFKRLGKVQQLQGRSRARSGWRTSPVIPFAAGNLQRP